MTKGRHIRAIGDGAAEIETGEIVETVEQGEGYGVEDTLPPWNDAFEEPVHQRRAWPIILSSLAVLAVLGWTAFYAWANRAAMLAGATPGQWIGWVTQWTVPVLLVAVAWLIAMRNSAREATRFGDAARVLSQESALLETRLVAVNRELSLAREFLAAQSRELDYLGRSAAERISEHAGKLQALVADNGAKVDAIAGVSVTALENMAQLRDNLPVIANSARDVTNQIGGAGRSAKTQLGELIAGFERLNEFGQASERQVVSLRERIDAALEDMAAFVETMDANNAARAETLRGEHDTARSELEARETEVHGAMRKRGEALRAELVAAHDARQLEEAAALAAMRGRIASFTREAHDAAATVRATERAALKAWESQVAGLRERLEKALEEVSTLDQNALDKAREKLAALTAEAEAVDTRLSERDRSFAARLAERQAAFDESEIAAFARLTERAAALDGNLAASHESQTAHADTIGERSEALAARVAEIDANIASVADRSAEAERALASSSEHFATAVSASSSQLGEAENTIARLTDSSVRLLELIQAAASHSRSELPAAIEGFEGKLGTARESSSQIRSALEDARRLGDELNTTLADMHGAGETAIGNLDAFRTRLTGTAEEQTAALSALREQLVAAGEENRALTESISGELDAAVARMGDGGRSSLADLERGQSEAFDGLREKMAAAGAEQTAHAEGLVRSLEDAVARLKDSSEAMLADLESDQGERVTALAAKDRRGKRAGHRPRDRGAHRRGGSQARRGDGEVCRRFARSDRQSARPARPRPRADRQPRNPRRARARTGRGAGRQRLLAPHGAHHREPQFALDRYRQGAFDRGHRHRLGILPQRRSRGVHAARGPAGRQRRSARDLAALRRRPRVPRTRQPLHPRFRGDAADHAVDPRRPCAGGNAAFQRHGQALRRAGAGNPAVAAVAQPNQRVMSRSSIPIQPCV